MPGMIIAMGGKPPKKGGAKPTMPPPEMPKAKPALAIKLGGKPGPDEETPEHEAAESPLGEIGEKYGLSEDDAKAFLREALDALLGGSTPGPEADEQYGQDQAA